MGMMGNMAPDNRAVEVRKINLMLFTLKNSDLTDPEQLYQPHRLLAKNVNNIIILGVRLQNHL